MNVWEINTPRLIPERNLILMPHGQEWDKITPPYAKLIVLDKRLMWAVDNTPDFNTVLANLGHSVLSPIYTTDYDFSNVPIFAAQAQMAGLLVARRRAYNLSALGVGKTIGSLIAIDWLLLHGHITRALIMAPLSILWNIWNDEIMRRMPRLVPTVIYGAADKRRKLLAAREWNVAIINHDGIGVVLEELRRINFGLIIVDEAASFRDTRTRKFKQACRLVHPAPFAAALTGSPTPNYPSDAFGLAKLFTPERVRMSFRSFRQSVESEVAQHRWLPRPDAAEKISKLLQPAVRFKRSDVIELADVTTNTYKVDLSPRQAEALKTLKKEAVARFPEGDVNAKNAAVMINKLLQIASGAVYTEDKSVVNLDPRNRIETARDLIAAAEGKAILLAPYIHITNILAKEFPDAAVVNGSVKPKDRSEIFRSFSDPLDPLRLLVAHPEVLAHGLNLTTANLIVWMAPIYSREIYEQANGRITRLGQEREQLIAHLCGSPIEQKVYDMLERKGTMQDVILEMFEHSTTGSTDKLVSRSSQASKVNGRRAVTVDDDSEFDIV